MVLRIGGWTIFGSDHMRLMLNHEGILIINKDCSLLFLGPCLYGTTCLADTDFLADFAVDFVYGGASGFFLWPVFWFLESRTISSVVVTGLWAILMLCLCIRFVDIISCLCCDWLCRS